MAKKFGGNNTATQFVTDSQDLESLAHYFPVCPDGMTGAFVTVANGDYVEVWVTDYSMPYSEFAIFERIA